jgi:hypothetical protein
MSTFRNPVGPQPPQVYWRRRLLVGLGALAVIVVVLLIVFRPGAEASSQDKKPASDTSVNSTTKPTEQPVQEEGAPCIPGNVAVEAITDNSQYGSGQQPMLSMSIVNNGPVACVMDVGTDQQLFEITSGAETYWKSTDCQSEPTPQKVALEPGAKQTTTPIPWDRTRSDPATCANERTPVTAGGASYHLKVSLGELKSEKSAQFLLY